MEKQLIELFGEEWYKLLKSFLNSQQFISILNQLKTEGKTNKIIPTSESKLLFKVFKDLQPQDIKIVILGKSPYNYYFENKRDFIYDGYAFSNSKSFPWEIDHILMVILEELERTYYEDLILSREDWSYLLKQGVFPINTALSTVENNVDVHFKLWEEFTKYWIKTLDNFNPNIYWMIWGDYLKNTFSNCIINGTKAFDNYPNYFKKNNFVGNDTFVRVNEWLYRNNIKTIQW